ncbi:MAG TPA: VIT and VWA domain-containing protein, partial [Planctomycetota bacterium]|nr:VIT and VWA domain-containing protein [Planctomycetota bacterium]
MRTALALALMTAAAHADGLLVDRRERPMTDSFAVKHHFVRVSIDEQYAITEVDQVLRNVSGHPAEAVYLFPVPHGANITGFEMWVGDRKMDGEVMDAAKARELYHSFVRTKRDPALLEYVGQGVYRTSVFPVGVDEEKRLRIKYTELLKKENGLVRYLYPLNTEKFSKFPLEEAKVEVTIKSKGKIKTVYSPSHTVDLQRASETSARAAWSVRRDTPRTDFEILYSTDEAVVGMNLLTYRPVADEPGYFLLLASPAVALEGPVEPKDIVFVLDKSGSMRADNKMGQAKEALTFCLRSLNDGDRFGIVSFSTGVDAYTEKLVPFTEAEKEKATNHVSRIEVQGGTNINDALVRALGLFEKGDRLKMVIFLTDGLPTNGVTDVQAIVRNVTAANALGVRLFNFGVGYDVNTTLLDKLARENKGDSDYVKPKENIEEKVSAFYTKIQSPVLSSLKLDWGQVKVKDVLPRTIPDLFKGGQVVVTGRYEGSGPQKLVLTGMSQGKERRFEVEGAFDAKSEGLAKFFTERLWAQRKIGDIIDQIQLYGKAQELVDEIVRLSVKYGIITEYTSFLIREDVRLGDAKGNARRAGEELRKLEKADGEQGNRQATAKKELQSAEKAAAPAAGGAFGKYKDEHGKEVEARTVANVGRRTFFQKKSVWQEADVPEGVPAVEVKFYSDEFFKLLEAHPELNQIAVLDGDVIVKVKDQHVRLTK